MDGVFAAQLNEAAGRCPGWGLLPDAAVLMFRANGQALSLAGVADRTHDPFVTLEPLGGVCYNSAVVRGDLDEANFSAA
jgi:hypothetical protein